MPFLTRNGFYRVTVSHLIIKPTLTLGESGRDGTYYTLTAHKILKGGRRGGNEGNSQKSHAPHEKMKRFQP